MEEIRDLSRRTDFNNLVYRCNGESGVLYNIFVGFKGLLVFLIKI